MTRLAGDVLTAVDFQLPDIATGYGNGSNTITSTSWANLPTTSCVAALTNPHPTASLLVLGEWGAWMHATTGGVRCCPAVSGALTLAAGPRVGGPAGWGEIPYTGNSGNPQQKSGNCLYELPPGVGTWTMQAMRDSSSGTQTVNYPTIRLIPLRYSEVVSNPVP